MPFCRCSFLHAGLPLFMDDTAPLQTPRKRPLAEPREKLSAAEGSSSECCDNSTPAMLNTWVQELTGHLTLTLRPRCARGQWLCLHKKYKAALPLGPGFRWQSWTTMRVSSKGVGCKACEWLAGRACGRWCIAVTHCGVNANKPEP